MLKQITLVALMVAASPTYALDKDISEMAERIGNDIDRLNDQLVQKAEAFEDRNGPITLPGGTEISIDDLTGGDPVALARRLGSEYTNLVMAKFDKSQAFPDFDPESMCREEVISNGADLDAYNGCIDMEQDSYDQWKSKWQGLDPVIQEYCIDFATFHGGSYERLGECLEIVLAKDEGLKAFQK
jgi:hypothetical protein